MCLEKLRQIVAQQYLTVHFRSQHLDLDMKKVARNKSTSIYTVEENLLRAVQSGCEATDGRNGLAGLQVKPWRGPLGCLACFLFIGCAIKFQAVPSFK